MTPKYLTEEKQNHAHSRTTTAMQNPSQEVHGVVELVNSSISPEIQMAAVNKFFTEDAGFRNPLFVVNSGPLSREKVLGVFQ